jgi:hypothetical protein
MEPGSPATLTPDIMPAMRPQRYLGFANHCMGSILFPILYPPHGGAGVCFFYSAGGCSSPISRRQLTECGVAEHLWITRS